MEGLFGTIARFWLAALAGAAAGWLLGQAVQWPVLGSVAGGLAGLTFMLLRDSRRAARLAAWLRDPQHVPAPRDRGLWGELGYRAERLVRGLQRDIDGERQHLAQFLSAIEASPNGVLLLDPENHIEWCNAIVSEHLGIDAVRDRGQAVTNLVRVPGFVTLMQGEAAGPLMIPLPGREGTLSVLVRPYAEGRKLVLTQDVTERLRTDTMRRDFVANVSHEIRSPLTVLAGFVETMATLQLTEAERARVLTLMRQQTDRMQTLVADLLALAQLEGSPRPPLDRWVPVAGLLTRVRADAVALSAGRHALQFDAPEGAQLAGQDSELVSALGNLVSNAIRYTPEHGRIEVHWIDRADGGASVEVADTGIGIAREHLPRLAERFYRVDSSRSRETGGTGLGLAIAKHAVQRHGGELEVESEPGKGSRFRLVFPAARVRRGTSVDLPAGATVH